MDYEYHKDGQYFYAPHRRNWGVWLYHKTSERGGHGEHIADYNTKEEARKAVYELNGWKLK